MGLGHHGRWGYKALVALHLSLSMLFCPLLLSLSGFFVQQRFDAHASSFRPEMATKCIGTREPTTTAPLFRVAELTSANELLFARMQAFMSLAIMLASERLATYSTDKWSLVCMGAKMGA